MRRELKIARILGAVFLLNLAVALTRLWLFRETGSAGIFADALHAVGDTVGSLVFLLGLWLSSRPPDAGHPQGHEKYETLAIRFVGGLIAASAIVAGYEAYNRLVFHRALHFSFWNLLFFCGTIAIGIVVTNLEHRAGHRHNSQMLHTDAEHTRADVAASIAVVVGYGATVFGLSFLDPLVGFGIAMYICFWKGVPIMVLGKAHAGLRALVLRCISAINNARSSKPEE